MTVVEVVMVSGATGILIGLCCGFIVELLGDALGRRAGRRHWKD